MRTWPAIFGPSSARPSTRSSRPSPSTSPSEILLTYVLFGVKRASRSLSSQVSAVPAGAAVEAELVEMRTKRAAELFWQARQELLLSDEELHTTLWEALCQFVSPPWPADGEGHSDSDPHGEVGRRSRRSKKTKETDGEGSGEEGE